MVRGLKPITPSFVLLPLAPLPIGGIQKVPMVVTQQINNSIPDDAKEKIGEIVQHPFSSITSDIISNALGFKDKLIDVANDLHQKALLTPDPHDDKIDYLKYIYDYADSSVILRFSPNWMKEMFLYWGVAIQEGLHDFTQWVTKSIYHLVSNVVLFTPEWLFGDAWFPTAVSKFTTLSIGVVSVVAMIEGIKRICKLSHTPFGYTLKRLPLALLVSGFTPFLFTNGVRWLNKLTRMITKLSTTGMTDHTSFSLSGMSVLFDPINFLSMLVFTGLFVWLYFPLFLFHAKRWFQLIFTGLLTPLAMSAYLFRNTKGYFDAWLDSIKNLGFSQLAYAVMISILGLLMFATPNPTTATGIFTKMLLLIGSMHMLAYPPSFVRSYSNEGGIVDMAKGLHGKYKTMKSKTESTIEKADAGAIGVARIAGKIFRWINKK